MQTLKGPCLRAGPVRCARTTAPTVAKPYARVLTAARAATEVLNSNCVTVVKDDVAAASNALSFNELTDILRVVNDTDIVELELKSKRFRLSLKKKEALQAEQVVAAPVMMAPAPLMAQPAAAPAVAAPSAVAPPPPAPVAAAPAPAPAPARIDGVEVCSPMSGTMYRSPAPGEPPFVREGDRVKKGQPICIVEAMKLMNEIEAECDGVVVKIVAENGKPVSPGTPLMIIKP